MQSNRKGTKEIRRTLRRFESASEILLEFSQGNPCISDFLCYRDSRRNNAFIKRKKILTEFLKEGCYGNEYQ